MKRAILCVGVNQYMDPQINKLAYAENDATELWAFFKHKAGYEDPQLLPAPDSDQVLESARTMVASLEPGDLFVFFFAGHGYEVGGKHLLLCPQAKLDLLEEYPQHVVPVSLLKVVTHKAEVDRVFVLDACRSPLRKDPNRRVGVAEEEGLRGAAGLRNLAKSEAGSRAPAGAFTMWCACDEGQIAREVPALRQGLFSRVFMEQLEGAWSSGAALKPDERLEKEVRDRMEQLAKEHHLPGNQRPWITRSGESPLLLNERNASSTPPEIVPVAPEIQSSLPLPLDLPAKPVVACPTCGLRNPLEGTFVGRQCGRDHLCRGHFVAAERCCEECAQHLADQRREKIKRETHIETATNT